MKRATMILAVLSASCISAFAQMGTGQGGGMMGGGWGWGMNSGGVVLILIVVLVILGVFLMTKRK